MREDQPDLTEDALIAATAEVTGQPPRKIRIAVRYYAAYPAEIDERIAANLEAADEAEAAWRAQQAVLRGKHLAS